MDPVRNPYAPGAGQRPPELAGRDRELEVFDVVLERVARARPERSLVLTGLRGVGKTVLLNTLRSEAISSEATIDLVKTTQPLVTPSSIHSLGTIYASKGKSAAVADAIVAGQRRLPINITGSSCHWKPIETAEARSHDEMLLQLSAPFINPFAHSEAGLFARLTLGGHDAQWYWVPLAQRKGVWAIGFVLPMDLHEG